MPSSTSPFERRARGPAVLLLVSALLALLLAAGYTLRLNPEIRLYRYAAHVKQAWAARLDRDFTNKVIVFGGSATSFAIDPARILERDGLPVVNFGLHAGMGAEFLTGFAAAAARPGDLLLMAIEPELLLSRGSDSDLAAQIGFALGHPEWIDASNVTGEPVHWVADLVSLRPGAYHVFTLLGKIALRRPLYRYHPDDFTPSGWQRTRERRAFGEPGRYRVSLSPKAHRLLAALRDWAKARHIRVAYLLPWRYAGPDYVRGFQEDNLRYLIQIAEYLPVLADERLGAYPVREHFADTPMHLTPAGARIRSDTLAAQLKAGRYWTRADLKRLLARYTPAR